MASTIRSGLVCSLVTAAALSFGAMALTALQKYPLQEAKPIYNNPARPDQNVTEETGPVTQNDQYMTLPRNVASKNTAIFQNPHHTFSEEVPFTGQTPLDKTNGKMQKIDTGVEIFSDSLDYADSFAERTLEGIEDVIVLTDKQRAELRAILEANSEHLKSFMLAPEDPQQLSNFADMQTAIRGVLSEEQYAILHRERELDRKNQNTEILGNQLRQLELQLNLDHSQAQKVREIVVSLDANYQKELEILAHTSKSGSAPLSYAVLANISADMENKYRTQALEQLRLLLSPEQFSLLLKKPNLLLNSWGEEVSAFLDQ